MAKPTAQQIIARNAELIARLRYQIREQNIAQKFESQTTLARIIAQSLECPVDSRVRQLERSNWALRGCLKSDDRDHREPTVRTTAQTSSVSEADWYYQDYRKRLDAAKRRTAEKERRRHGVVGRRRLAAEWLELYRTSDCPCGLRELIKAIKLSEKGE